jgi:hypothetical protein
MSTSTLRVVLAVVLIAHGLGHALGMLSTAGLKLSDTHAPNSWLFTPLLGGTPARVVGFVFWLAALLTFVGAGLALAGWAVPRPWWHSLAIAASVTSLAALVLYWHGLPFFFPNKVGVVAVDLAVLYSRLWLHWPTAGFHG